jgi:hypothetical protein
LFEDFLGRLVVEHDLTTLESMTSLSLRTEIIPEGRVSEAAI